MPPDEETSTDNTEVVSDPAPAGDATSEATGFDAAFQAATQDLTPEPSEVDTDPEPSAATYKVTVDGDELDVSLDELLGGYQRQADYTRKTQALGEAKQRSEAYEALETALQNDPASVLAELAKSYGLDAPASDVDDFADDPLVDPQVAELTAQVRALTEFQQGIQQEREITRVDQELAQVSAKYEDADMDRGGLLKFALDNRIGNLDAAYRAWKFDATTHGAPAAETPAPTHDEQATDSKRNLPPIEGGTTRTPSATVPGAGEKMTVRQALDSAAKSLGLA